MYFGTVTGEGSKPDQFVTNTYWKENVRQPVQFQQAVQNTFIDIKSTAFDSLKLSLKCALRTGFGPISRVLNVKCAYHSHHTEKASKELEHALEGLTGNTPNVELMSTVTGEGSKPDQFVTNTSEFQICDI
jgi:acyl transferase domain-containing protein